MFWLFKKKRNIGETQKGHTASNATVDDSSLPANSDENDPSSSEILTLLFELGVMNLHLSENDGKANLFITDRSDSELLNRIGTIIHNEFNGEWLLKANGLDQCYWDIKIESSVLTLHLEHYLGIMIFPAEDSGDITRDNALLERIYNYLSSHDASFQLRRADASE